MSVCVSVCVGVCVSVCVYALVVGCCVYLFSVFVSSCLRFAIMRGTGGRGIFKFSRGGWEYIVLSGWWCCLIFCVHALCIYFPYLLQVVYVLR